MSGYFWCLKDTEDRGGGSLKSRIGSTEKGFVKTEVKNGCVFLMRERPIVT